MPKIRRKYFKYEKENSKLTYPYIKAYLNNKEIYQHLLSILKTCQYNTIFFEELTEDALKVINYMEEKYPELKKVNETKAQ